MLFSFFFIICIFAQGFSLKMQLTDQKTMILTSFIRFFASTTLKTFILDRFLNENTIKLIGGWGVRAQRTQPGNRFVSFVRACARAARDQLRLPRAICRMNVFSVSARLAFFQKCFKTQGLKNS